MAKGRKERQEEKKQKEGGAEPQIGRDFWAELKKYLGLKQKRFGLRQKRFGLKKKIFGLIKKGNTSRIKEERGAKDKGIKQKNKKKKRKGGRWVKRTREEKGTDQKIKA